tara:strand:- start:2351 stop:3091 length:741 start_codon:yes stop_codon:yes gene_type:complete
MSKASATAKAFLASTRKLSKAVAKLPAGGPVTHIYNPLEYAWAGYEAYVTKFLGGPRRVVLLGMNPGPYGMTQTGVPFGAIPAVRDWMGIEVAIKQPAKVHPKRPIEGFACKRNEVSGRRLWIDLFSEQFPNAKECFKTHFALNYCPLVYMIESGANFTPDKLPVAVRRPLEEACDTHLREALEIIQPEWAIGVGNYAEKCLLRITEGMGKAPKVTRIIHPAPASPIANREWPENPRKALADAGIW